jgi:hypothetical protein
MMSRKNGKSFAEPKQPWDMALVYDPPVEKSPAVVESEGIRQASVPSDRWTLFGWLFPRMATSVREKELEEEVARLRIINASLEYERDAIALTAEELRSYIRANAATAAALANRWAPPEDK